MKLSWILVIILLVTVAVFSVQNADPIQVRFLGWEITMSAALVIQLAALLGGIVGLTVGACSRRKPAPRAEPVVLPEQATEYRAGTDPESSARRS